MQYVVKEGEGEREGRDDRVGCCCCCCEREGEREAGRKFKGRRRRSYNSAQWRGREGERERGDGELERRRRGEQKYLRGTFFLCVSKSAARNVIVNVIIAIGGKCVSLIGLVIPAVSLSLKSEYRDNNF